MLSRELRLLLFAQAVASLLLLSYASWKCGSATARPGRDLAVYRYNLRQIHAALH